jgi:hypothetical protein
MSHNFLFGIIARIVTTKKLFSCMHTTNSETFCLHITIMYLPPFGLHFSSSPTWIFFHHLAISLPKVFAQEFQPLKEACKTIQILLLISKNHLRCPILIETDILLSIKILFVSFQSKHQLLKDQNTESLDILLDWQGQSMQRELLWYDRGGCSYELVGSWGYVRRLTFNSASSTSTYSYGD